MALSRIETAVLALAGVTAVAVPALLLRGPASSAAAAAAPAPPLAVAVPPPLTAALSRPLFVAAGPGDEPALPEDAPQLIGIAGRIGRDAVALVRGADGTGRTLAVGDAIDGWTLESLAIDAALFRRGTQRARVPLPAG